MRDQKIRTRALAAINGLARRMYQLNEYIFEHPELGFQEHLACSALCGFLREHGFEIQQGIAHLQTAFVAGYPSLTKEGPIVALLAEYDALPDIGHGCGHNMIGVASCAAAISVRHAVDKFGLDGTIMVIGCPAEEGSVEGAGSKAELIQYGVFEKVDVAMMVHPAARTLIDPGFAAREALKISFYGKAAHAACWTEEHANAFEALLQMFNRINALRQRLTPGAKIHGIISNGGKSPNVIPEYTEAKLYVRAHDDCYLEEVVELVKDCAREAAGSTGVSVRFERFAHRYKKMVTNSALGNAFEQNLRLLNVPVHAAPNRGFGSTDMGNVSLVVPSIHPYMAIDGITAPIHTREFAKATVSTQARKTLLNSAKALALTALDVLEDAALLARIKREFLAATSVQKRSRS